MIVCWTSTRFIGVKQKFIFSIRHTSSDLGRRAALSALGLSDGASQNDIREAYLQLTKESHPDLNKDPKASEDFQRVKMAYDRLRSSQDEEERLRTSEKEYESREEEERRQGRGNTFKPGGFKGWREQDDWVNRVAEEGRQKRRRFQEENKWQERIIKEQRRKGNFSEEELKRIRKMSNHRDDGLDDGWHDVRAGLLSDNLEKNYSSFEKAFVAQLEKLFPTKKSVVVSKISQQAENKTSKSPRGEAASNIFFKALWGSWVLFTRSIFHLPVPLTLGVVWTVVLVLISIEIMQPEEKPDFVEHQSKVTELARQRAAHDCVKRGTLEDIQLEKPATR